MEYVPDSNNLFLQEKIKSEVRSVLSDKIAEYRAEHNGKSPTGQELYELVFSHKKRRSPGIISAVLTHYLLPLFILLDSKTETKERRHLFRTTLECRLYRIKLL